jgi:hypothetical protein
VQLAITKPNPMNATLLARPARACILLSDRPGLDWKALTVAAIAARARIWGSPTNAILPVPSTPVQQELFWALASLLDPDTYLQHQPSWTDLADLTPGQYAKQEALLKRELRRLGADVSLVTEQLAETLDPVDLPEGFADQLLARTAPLHNAGQLLVMAFGSGPGGIHPLTDAVQVRPLPPSLTEVQPSSDPVERLLLAAEFGELTPQLRQELIDRDVTINMRTLPHRHELQRWLFGLGGPGWPATAATLGTEGLEWFSLGRRPELTATIVVGEDQWDFTLAHTLRSVQRLAWWLPPSYLHQDGGIPSIVSRFAGLRAHGIRVFITTTSDPKAADELAAALAVTGNQGGVERRDWAQVLPRQASRLLLREPAGSTHALYRSDAAMVNWPFSEKRQVHPASVAIVSSCSMTDSAWRAGRVVCSESGMPRWTNIPGAR